MERRPPSFKVMERRPPSPDACDRENESRGGCGGRRVGLGVGRPWVLVPLGRGNRWVALGQSQVQSSLPHRVVGRRVLYAALGSFEY